ncbi:S8 family serine peptidase [Brevibacillus sp. SAFN-007a]|uniref:S8 family serine peptidase n=1 Tax=Brevibacillus sp. SAFN-007a TaxID=3436862 RepID=UPI003F7F9DD9
MSLSEKVLTRTFSSLLVVCLTLNLIGTPTALAAQPSQLTTGESPKSPSDTHPITALDTTKIQSKNYLIGLKNHVNAETFLERKGLKNKGHKKVKSTNALVISLTADEVKQVTNDTEVSFVEEDASVKIASTGNVVSTHAALENIESNTQTIPWGIQDIGVNYALQQSIVGDKVKIAVLDTGISHHPDLNLAGGVSLVTGVPDYTDDNGHGTHVAGTIAALHNDRGVVGAASHAQIYSVKVLDKDGNGSYSQVIQGIDWAIENKMNIVSMSLGGSVPSKALHDAIKKASERGILIIAAAGNNGAGLETETYPALFPEVISVGVSISI